MRWFTRTAAEQTADDPWGMGPEESWGKTPSVEEQFKDWSPEPESQTPVDPGQDILSNLGEDAHRKWTELSKLSEQRQETQRSERLQDWGLQDTPDDPIVQELEALKSLRSQGDWAGLAKRIEADYDSFVTQSPNVTQQDPRAQAARALARRVKNAGVNERAGGMIPKKLMAALSNLEGVLVKLLGRDPKKRRATIALDDVVDEIKLELWKTDYLPGPSPVSQQDPQTEAPAKTFRSTRRVKTANDDEGNMVQCPGCDEYVAKGEMDPTGKCEDCQREAEAAYAHNRGHRIKVAMKCQGCGDEVDKVDAHGDCVSCQQKAELDEPALSSRDDSHWTKVARVKHELNENIMFAETCAVCDKMSRKAPGDPEDGGLCPHCGTSGQFVSSSEQLGRMLRGRERKEPEAEAKVPSSLRGVGL